MYVAVRVCVLLLLAMLDPIGEDPARERLLLCVVEHKTMLGRGLIIIIGIII